MYAACVITIVRALLVFLSLVVLSPAGATPVQLDPIASGLDRPVQAVSANDHSGRVYIAELPGRIRVADRPSDPARLFLDFTNRVSCCANGGLLSVVFHPRYAENGYFFVQYVDVSGNTTVARYSRSRVDPDTADAASAEVLLVVPQPKDNLPNHHGGTLRFGPDGFLYISIGDGGAEVEVTNRAQELHHLLGKLLRIDVDRAWPYTIPPDNPYAGVPGARGEIWALGLRNPWRFTFDSRTGGIIVGDVGQHAREELDILSYADARGANFGWPVMEGSQCFPAGAPCSRDGLVLPQVEYAREGGCSITAGFRYRGTRSRRLAETVLYGDFCSGRLWTAFQNGGSWSATLLADTDLLIVSIDEDETGEPYIVDYRGAVYTLVAPPIRRRAVRH